MSMGRTLRVRSALFMLAITFSFALISTAVASGATWAATGSMANPRYDHTATLLPNGKVLVTGGYGISGYLASVELYDPSTSTWTSTGLMVNPRYHHAVPAHFH